MALEPGDLAHLTAVFTTVTTRGTIARASQQLHIEDPADYTAADPILIQGAAAQGADLITTISAIIGHTATLADQADNAVTNAPVGKLTDPTTVQCIVTAPDGTQTTTTAAQDGPGQWHTDYAITHEGVHRYEFTGSGAAVGVISGVFEVQPTGFATLTPRSLCTLDELKQFIGNVQAGDDANLIAAINAATARIYREAGREFVARNAVRNPTTGIVTAAAETRRFDITPLLAKQRELSVGDIAATVWNTGTLTIATGNIQSATTDPVSTADISLLPRVRTPSEPITRIRFPLTVFLPWRWDSYVDVTAVWGFPTVPDDIREACQQLAFGSYLRDPRRRSRQVDDQGQDLPRTLIGTALRTARDYRIDAVVV